MRFMADELAHRRSPANVVAHMQQLDVVREAAFAKAGRNDLCPCGSGIKFKKCHGKPR